MEKLSEIRSTFDAKRLGSHDPTAQKVTIMKHKGTALVRFGDNIPAGNSG
jgi:hypothetical protein